MPNPPTAPVPKAPPVEGWPKALAPPNAEAAGCGAAKGEGAGAGAGAPNGLVAGAGEGAVPKPMGCVPKGLGEGEAKAKDGVCGCVVGAPKVEVEGVVPKADAPPVPKALDDVKAEGDGAGAGALSAAKGVGGWAKGLGVAGAGAGVPKPKVEGLVVATAPKGLGDAPVRPKAEAPPDAGLGAPKPPKPPVAGCCACPSPVPPNGEACDCACGCPNPLPSAGAVEPPNTPGPASPCCVAPPLAKPPKPDVAAPGVAAGAPAAPKPPKGEGVGVPPVPPPRVNPPCCGAGCCQGLMLACLDSISLEDGPDMAQDLSPNQSQAERVTPQVRPFVPGCCSWQAGPSRPQPG